MSENSRSNLFARISRALGLAAWIVFGLYVIALGIAGLIFNLLPAGSQDYLSEESVGQVILNLLIYLLALSVIVLVPYAIMKRRAKHKPLLRDVLGLQGGIKAAHFGLLGLAFIGYYVSAVIVGLLARFLPWYDAEQVQEVGFQGISTPFELAMAFIALVVLAPIVEELLFRGYFFGKLRSRNGFWFSTILTSILFGAIHGQWNVAVDTFVLSIFLCLLREKTGNIWMSICLHALKNGIAYFILFIVPVYFPDLLK